MAESPVPANPHDLNTKARRDHLVNEYLDCRAAAEKYAIRIAELAEQIVRDLGTGGRHEIMPGVGVRVQAPAMTFNADKAREVLTGDQYRSICRLHPDAKVAEQILPGALVDQCRVPGVKPSVRSL